MGRPFGSLRHDQGRGGRVTSLALAAAAVVGLAGCGASPTGPGGPGGSSGNAASVSLAIALGISGAQGSLGPSFDLVLMDGASTLSIQRVAVVLREIELKLENDDLICDDSRGGSSGSSSSSSSSSSRDGCDEFEVGPFLIELPLDGGTETVIQLSDVLPGRYDELRFDIHKPDDNTADDIAFIQAHPDFRRVSVRVEGLFNDQPFTYLTDLNEKQRIALVPPIDVGAGDATQVTLSLAVDDWFRRNDGSLLDPATGNKGGPNENLIRDNIRESIEGFEDRDRDGHR